MNKRKRVQEYKGGCLCNETTYIAKAKPTNPHLCSCTMCQRSSGALTVAWVDFPMESFRWTKSQPNLYQSSEKTFRCSCKKCGGLLAAIVEGCPTICLTIATLKNPNLIVPGKQHSYKENAPSWWKVSIKYGVRSPKVDHT
jgi:hypothetical protein